ncbi:hypothetical protein [Lacticaseibacillus thailandensis]|nr:hypothetical protein [Lacticaseibacillus thailandensis]
MKSVNLGTASNQDLIELGRSFNIKYNMAGMLGDKATLKSTFKQYRKMDARIPDKNWYPRSSIKVKNQLQDAFYIILSNGLIMSWITTNGSWPALRAEAFSVPGWLILRDSTTLEELAQARTLVFM